MQPLRPLSAAKGFDSLGTYLGLPYPTEAFTSNKLSVEVRKFSQIGRIIQANNLI